MRRKLLFTTIIVTVMTLSGCTATKSDSDTTFSVKLQADQNINPNRQGKASPVDIRIYQLTSPGLFEQADFFSLYPSAGKLLGDSYIQMTEILIAPGETKNLRIPLTSNTKWFGILAAFSEINATCWSDTVPVIRRWWRPTSLSITVHQSKIDIKE